MHFIFAQMLVDYCPDIFREDLYIDRSLLRRALERRGCLGPKGEKLGGEGIRFTSSEVPLDDLDEPFAVEIRPIRKTERNTFHILMESLEIMLAAMDAQEVPK